MKCYQSNFALPDNSLENIVLEKDFKEGVIVNFMCQLDQTNIIPGVSVGDFWMKRTFGFIDWVKQVALPNVGRPNLFSWRN